MGHEIDATLRLFGDEIAVRSSSEPFFAHLHGFEHLFYIREYGFERRPSTSEYRFTYVDDPRPSLEWDDERRALTLTEAWPRIAGTTLVRALALLVTERRRQDAGRFLVQAAAVERDGRGLVIAGPSGSGKTSLAIRLCQAHGARLVSNSFTVVGIEGGVLRIVAGTPLLKLRRSSVEASAPSGGAAVFDGARTTETWNEKREVHPSRLGIESSAGPVELTAWINVALQPGWRGDVSFHRCPSEVRPDAWLDKAELAEQLVRYVRGSAIALMRDDQRMHPDLVMPLLDSRVPARHRAEFLETLFDAGRVHALRGTVDDAAPLVAELLSGGSPS